MRVLIQRVLSASVHVEGELIGHINQGLLALVGLEPTDSVQTLIKMANKLLAYRVFNDPQGKMNLSLQEINGGLLLVSQFTLAAEKYTELKAAIKDDHEELVHAAEACLQTFEHDEEALEFSAKAFEQIQDEETYILHIKCLRRNNYLEAAHAISHQGKLRFPGNQVLEKLYCSTYIQLDDTNAIASILNAIAKNIPEQLEDMDI